MRPHRRRHARPEDPEVGGDELPLAEPQPALLDLGEALLELRALDQPGLDVHPADRRGEEQVEHRAGDQRDVGPAVGGPLRRRIELEQALDAGVEVVDQAAGRRQALDLTPVVEPLELGRPDQQHPADPLGVGQRVEHPLPERLAGHLQQGLRPAAGLGVERLAGTRGPARQHHAVEPFEPQPASQPSPVSTPPRPAPWEPAAAGRPRGAAAAR